QRGPTLRRRRYPLAASGRRLAASRQRGLCAHSGRVVKSSEDNPKSESGRLLFPGSAWEHTVLQALPAPEMARPCLPNTPFPGKAWERENPSLFVSDFPRGG